MKEYVKVGVISSAHGIKGEVKIKSFAGNPENIGKLPLLVGKEKRQLTIGRISGKGEMLIASINGISDRNAAQALAGQSLYVLRENLPELLQSEFYQHDLIGLAARLENGEILGEIIAFHNFGAGDLIEIRLAGGEEKLFPFNSKTVPEVNQIGGYLVINPPEEV